ncbi:hypothetical protein IAR50_000436 [Cryptococcus sp. DSM 104548]
MSQPSSEPFPTPPSYRTDSSHASSSSYVTAHSSPYNSPNPAYTPPTATYPPNYYAPGPSSSPQQRIESQVRRSRGNEYLLGLNTAMSNLELHGSRIGVTPPRATDPPAQPYQSGGARQYGYYAEPPRQRYYSTPAMSPVSPNTNKTLPPLPSEAQSISLESCMASPSRVSPGHPKHMADASLAGDAPLAYGLPPPPPLPPRPSSLPPSMLPYAIPSGGFLPRQSPSQNVMAPVSRSGLSPGRPQSDPQIVVARPERRTSPRTSPRGKENSQPGPSTPIKKPPSGQISSRHRWAKPDPDGEYTPIIDLTLSSPDSPSSPPLFSRKGPQSPSPSRPRAHSDIRNAFLTSPSPASSPARRKSPSKSIANASSSLASSPSKKPLTPTSKVGVQCSGFTRTGAPCKRIVRAHAPYLATPIGGREDDDEGDIRSERVMGRYCKDHAGMICKTKGFYWRNGEGEDASKVWIDFEDYVPRDLSEQTQTLIIMTMEGRLTPKEKPGYLYVYELRDLESDDLSFYKCGRTDNVPRRIGQWTHQCQSKTPSLLDIFPRPDASTSIAPQTSGSDRSQELITSFLQGATTHVIPPLPAMKRWERLVHIELAERCALDDSSKRAFEKVRLKCVDCSSVHREIFPLPKEKGSKSNYYIVEECVERWGRFIEAIHG